MRLLVAEQDDYKVYAEMIRGIDGLEFLDIFATDIKKPEILHHKMRIRLESAARARLAQYLLSQ